MLKKLKHTISSAEIKFGESRDKGVKKIFMDTLKLVKKAIDDTNFIIPMPNLRDIL